MFKHREKADAVVVGWVPEPSNGNGEKKLMTAVTSNIKVKANCFLKHFSLSCILK